MQKLTSKEKVDLIVTFSSYRRFQNSEEFCYAVLDSLSSGMPDQEEFKSFCKKEGIYDDFRETESNLLGDAFLDYCEEFGFRAKDFENGIYKVGKVLDTITGIRKAEIEYLLNQRLVELFDMLNEEFELIKSREKTV